MNLIPIYQAMCLDTTCDPDNSGVLYVDDNPALWMDVPEDFYSQNLNKEGMRLRKVYREIIE